MSVSERKSAKNAGCPPTRTSASTPSKADGTADSRTSVTASKVSGANASPVGIALTTAASPFGPICTSVVSANASMLPSSACNDSIAPATCGSWRSPPTYTSTGSVRPPAENSSLRTRNARLDSTSSGRLAALCVVPSSIVK